MAIVISGGNYAIANITTPINVDAADMTFAYYLKVGAYDGGFAGNLYDNDKHYKYMGVSPQATPSLRARVRDEFAAGTTLEVQDTAPPAVDIWVPVVIRMDAAGNSMDFWVNGVSKGANTANIGTSAADKIGLGVVKTTSGVDNSGDCQIAHLRLWRRRLSDAEVGVFSSATAKTDIDGISATNLIQSSDLIADGTANTGSAFALTGATFNADDPLSGGAPAVSISAADSITAETGTATFTLANNAGAPTAARLNGTDLGTLTSQGAGVYQYSSLLLPDDPTATLAVDVDAQTLSTTISYANSYPIDFTHGTPAANSLMFGNQFGSLQNIELKIVSDLAAGIATEDWQAHNFLADVEGQITPVSDGETSVTIGYYVTETGETGTFSRSIVVGEQVVVTPPDTSWPFPVDTPKYPLSCEWGKRHPKTGARTRMYKRGGQ